MDRSRNQGNKLRRALGLGAVFISAGLAIIFIIKFATKAEAPYKPSPEVTHSQITQERDLLQIEKCHKLSSHLKASESNSGNQISIQELEFFEVVDNLLNPEGQSADHHDAYVCLNATKEKLKHSGEFFWRFAMATHVESVAETDEDLKESLMYSAFESAEMALRLNDQSADAHKWVAITAGSKGEFLGINERIQSGFAFKEHIDKAIQLSPDDPELHHLLGRFCYEASKISWFERTVASSIFSIPPSSTAEEALGHFETAERIGKPTKENRLYIAKAYIEMSDYKNAALWLNSASLTSGISQKDITAQKEISTLLTKYHRYL